MSREPALLTSAGRMPERSQHRVSVGRMPRANVRRRGVGRPEPRHRWPTWRRRGQVENLPPRGDCPATGRGQPPSLRGIQKMPKASKLYRTTRPAASRWSETRSTTASSATARSGTHFRSARHSEALAGSPNSLRSRFGAAHAPSPDVRFGHPALRSLDADCAPASCLRWSATPALGTWAAPHGCIKARGD